MVVLGQLLWQHSDGGIVSHHLLHNPDLPAISNAWGLLLLPLLTWWLSGRIERRLKPRSDDKLAHASAVKRIGIAFLLALAWGSSIAMSFTWQWPIDPGVLLLAVAVLAVAIPVHRAECVIGFVLPLSLVFGAVLATAATMILASWSALLHEWMYPAFRTLLARRREADDHP